MALAVPILMAACGGGGGAEVPAPAPPIERHFTNFQAASAVIGQRDPESGEPNQGGSIGDAGLDTPRGLAVTPDGGLFVADSFNYRVLHFDAIPAASGVSAKALIGQPGFQTATPMLTRTGLVGPTGVAVGAGKIVVADTLANRVLIYDYPLPTDGTGPSASVVIGQGDFESDTSGCDADKLNRPAGVAITPQGQLIVADSLNHRVLVWDTIPGVPDNVPPPALVLGQETLTHCVSNDDLQDGSTDVSPVNGEPVATARTLDLPTSVWSDGKRLVVADHFNDRVLVWTSFPEESYQRANLVLGHSTFSDTLANSEMDGETDRRPTARTLDGPTDVHSDGRSLVVADTNNHRVLVWNAFPEHSFQPADAVLGHTGFDQRLTNDGDGDELTDVPTAQVFRRPLRVLLTGDELLVADDFHRVLIFRK